MSMFFKRIVLLSWLMIFFGAGAFLHLPEYRCDTGRVVAVTDIPGREVDVVTVQTSDGNLWQFNGYRYDGDERVFLFFNTKGTWTIYDDEIAGVRVR